MIIDGHSHAFGEFGKTEKLIHLMDKIGVDKVVLCPGGAAFDAEFEVPKFAYTRISRIGFLHIFGNIFFLRKHHDKMPVPDNERVYSLVKKHPDRLIQFYWVKPQDPKMLDSLEEDYKKMSFAGIKLHQCVTVFSNKDDELRFLSKFAAEKKIPIFIHLYSFREVRNFVSLARKHPKTNYIIAHLMGFETIARKGNDLKNVYFDISPYYIISEKRIIKALKRFGDNKVLLGSDSPLGDRNLEMNIRKIRNMDITEKQKKMILGDNLAKLLKL